jgi:hypothetical protein
MAADPEPPPAEQPVVPMVARTVQPAAKQASQRVQARAVGAVAGQGAGEVITADSTGSKKPLFATFKEPERDGRVTGRAVPVKSKNVEQKPGIAAQRPGGV